MNPLLSWFKKKSLRPNCLLTRYPIFFQDAKNPLLKKLIEVTKNHGYPTVEMPEQLSSTANFHYVALIDSTLEFKLKPQSTNLIAVVPSALSQIKFSESEKALNQYTWQTHESALGEVETLKTVWLNHLNFLAEEDFLNSESTTSHP